jgi:molybdate transport system substrate-binding protein
MKQLGIADAVAAKTRLVGGTALTDAVAGGELELGLAPVSEIVSDPRVELVGPVPAELQEVTILSAAVTTSSTAPADAQALVDFLAGPASAAELAARALK